MLYKNQYKEPEEGILGKLMGGFDKKPTGTPLGIEVDKPSFALDESLSHTQAQPITEVESRPISQPKEGEAGKKGWLSNAWNKVKGSFGAEVTGGTDGPPKIEEGVGHKIMRYALPALMSLGGGAGMLPGLMAGMAGSSKGRQAEMEASADWNKVKTAEQLKREQMQADALKQAQADKFKQSGLDISRARLGLEQEKAGLGKNDDIALSHLANYDKETQNSIMGMTDNDLIGSAATATDPKEKAMYKAILKQRKSSKMYKGE
jgi:hypothetical protein